MVNEGIDIWGKFNLQSNDVHLHNKYLSGDEKMLNKTAINTLSARGNVFILHDEKMPEDSPLAAAILRF
mgnify:FL=1